MLRDLDVSCPCSAACSLSCKGFHFNLSMVVLSTPDRLQGLCKGCLYVPQCVLYLHLIYNLLFMVRLFTSCLLLSLFLILVCFSVLFWLLRA